MKTVKAAEGIKLLSTKEEHSHEEGEDHDHDHEGKIMTMMDTITEIKILMHG
ncbi:hypothetical protein ACEQPO_22835 [Bacillus sp. SL00103]